MKPFECAIELSKFINGRYVWGDFSYIANVDAVGKFQESVILLEVDTDGVQHFCTVDALNYKFVASQFEAFTTVDD